MGGQNRGFLVDFEGGGPSINWQYQGRGVKMGQKGGVFDWGVFDFGGVSDVPFRGGWSSCHGGGDHSFGWWWS